jgi:hypothetical protein
MFCYKIHRSRAEKYEIVLAICDKELKGKKLRENPEFLIDKKFYGEEECEEEKAIELLEKCTIANLTGKKIIKLALDKNFITRENIILIGDVPHAQIVK